mgnify:CR=1 FL=1
MSEAEIIRMFKEQMTIKAIAEKLGVSRPYVYKRLKGKVQLRGKGSRRKPRFSKDDFSKEEIAYFAGLIDGEGTLSLYRDRKGGVVPCLQIANSSFELMSWLQKRFKGQVRLCQPKGHSIGKYKTRKDVYSWTLFRTLECKILLELILPYLIVKKKEAKDLLAKIEKHLKEKPLPVR